MHLLTQTLRSLVKNTSGKRASFLAVIPRALSLLALSVCVTGNVWAADAFSVLDAHERGTTVTGAAKGTMTATFDEGIRKDVLEFDYTVPQGAGITAWAKGFPAGLTQAAVSTAKVGVKTLTAEQAGEVSVTLEVRGDLGAQLIPLHLQNGWNSTQEKLDWAKVGALKEVAFVVAPQGATAVVKGTLSFALEFMQAPLAAAAKPLTKAVVLKAAEKKVNAAMVSAKETFAKVEKSVPAPAVTAVKSVTPKAMPATRVSTPPVVPASTSFGLLDAGDKGVLPAGEAKGTITFSFDEEAKKDVYDLGYTLTPGSSLNVWTKKFPADLTAAQVNTLTIGLRSLDPSQLNQLAIRMEVIGTLNTQGIPLNLKPGWNSVQKTIAWDKIGDLKEVNFVITPKGNAGALKGTLYLGFDFCKSSFFANYFEAIKFGSVFLLALLLSLLVSFLAKFQGGDRGGAKSKTAGGEGLNIVSPKETTLLPRLMKDLLYGAITVLALGTAIWIYMLGFSAAGSIRGILAAGILGALIAECLKHQFTGKHLTAGEVFQNVLVTGVLAASSSPLELLQMPSMWGHLLMINMLTATVAFVIYQIFNANAFATSGKNFKPVASLLTVGTPYLIGWLLLLENVTLLQTLTYTLSGGLLAAWPWILEGVGRFIVVLVFNELLANGIAYVTKGRLIKTGKAHFFLAFVSPSGGASPDDRESGIPRGRCRLA